MDLLGHINVKEMLGDLTVTTFLILLAASVAVASLMVLFPLIDLAFEKKVKSTMEKSRRYGALSEHHELWQTGRPWLDLRSDFLRPDALPPSKVMGDPTAKRGGAGPLRFSSSAAVGALNHTTSLIKRTNTATQKGRNLIVPIKEPATPPNPVETIPQRPRAA